MKSKYEIWCELIEAIAEAQQKVVYARAMVEKAVAVLEKAEKELGVAHAGIRMQIAMCEVSDVSVPGKLGLRVVDEVTSAN
jgi:hypothetical protein